MDTRRITVDSFEYVKNPALRQVISYWFSTRSGRPMPARRDISPIEIRSALAQIWLCDYLSESGRCRYRLAGEEINDFWGFNLRGRYMDDVVPDERLTSVRNKVRMAIDLPAIVYDRACLSLTEEITRKGEQIILPLSDDGRTVNGLLGATHRDWFRDLEFDPYTAYSETTTVAALESSVPIH